MATIVIKKKVNLDFLGDEYKDSYLIFRSMPISEYDKLLTDLEGADNKASLRMTVKILKENFIEGKFLTEDVAKDDLEQFDIETLVSCLEIFTGQRQSPKG